MRAHYPPMLVHPTPDDVLAILRDMHRHDSFAYHDVDLSHDTTIAQWREADDMAAWKKIARYFNAYWHVNIPLDQWQHALTPPDTRRLRDLCALLSRHIQVPRIRPARLLGTPCAPAGAFLTIRSYLAADGADVDDLAPSSPLAPYLRQNTNTFLLQISQLAPGTLPTVEVHAPLHKAGCAFLFFSLIFLLFANGTGASFAALAPAIWAILFCAYLIAAILIPPSRVELPGLKTFRDLSTAIAIAAKPLASNAI